MCSHVGSHARALRELPVADQAVEGLLPTTNKQIYFRSQKRYKVLPVADKDTKFLPVTDKDTTFLSVTDKDTTFLSVADKETTALPVADKDSYGL